MHRKIHFKSSSLLVLVLLAAGLAFYGGRAYQNGIDKPLFTQYMPSSSVSAGSGATTGSSTDSSLAQTAVTNGDSSGISADQSGAPAGADDTGGSPPAPPGN